MKLKEAGFKAKLKKCTFLKPKVEYLGHIIDKSGLHKNPKKVEAMLKMSRPTNVTEAQAFIGMVNYYGKFIPNLSALLNPIFNLLKKGQVFKWTNACESAFQAVKRELVSERVLVHFNPKEKIKLACDASSVGIGAVLMHVFQNSKERPVCYASRTLTKAEKNYSVIHREALAIYWGVQKFYQYLKGVKFILQSDHKPLKALFGEEKGIPQMAAGRI